MPPLSASLRHHSCCQCNRQWAPQAAENAFTDAVMASSGALQEELYSEIMGRMPVSDSSVPQRSGQYWYYRLRRPGASYHVHCRFAALQLPLVAQLRV